MSRNAKNEIIFERQISYDEAIENIEAISVKDIKEIAAMLFDNNEISFYAVGPKSLSKVVKELQK